MPGRMYLPDPFLPIIPVLLPIVIVLSFSHVLLFAFAIPPVIHRQVRAN